MRSSLRRPASVVEVVLLLCLLVLPEVTPMPMLTLVLLLLVLQNAGTDVKLRPAGSLGLLANGGVPSGWMSVVPTTEGVVMPEVRDDFHPRRFRVTLVCLCDRRWAWDLLAVHVVLDSAAWWSLFLL